MVRDLNKEEAEIRNGNRFIRETQGTGVFPRDVDRLFRKYANLRHKVYNTNKDAFADEATRRELRSYIDEQFVKLTKEYDINGAVDFPFYIKKMLNLRVSGSFVKSTSRGYKRERLGSKAEDIYGLLPDDVQTSRAIEDSELIDELLTSANFTELEVDIFTQLTQGRVKERELTKELAEKHNISLKATKEAIKDVKDYLSLKLRK